MTHLVCMSLLLPWPSSYRAIVQQSAPHTLPIGLCIAGMEILHEKMQHFQKQSPGHAQHRAGQAVANDSGWQQLAAEQADAHDPAVMGRQCCASVDRPAYVFQGLACGGLSLQRFAWRSRGAWHALNCQTAFNRPAVILEQEVYTRSATS